MPQLSPREREIMHLMAEGLTAEAIGEEITVSVETVRTHVRNVDPQAARAQSRARDRDRAAARRDLDRRSRRRVTRQRAGRSGGLHVLTSASPPVRGRTRRRRRSRGRSSTMLPGRQLLLQPVEGAETAAEVVDHVHERRLARARNHGAAVGERAVVAEDDVAERPEPAPAGSRSRSSIARRTR